MLSGQRFTLQTPTMAVDADGGKGKAVTIPAAAVIKVISRLRGADHMIQVLWEGRVLQMFAIDVEERGTEIMEK
jgi:hypothetical protein